MRRYTITTKLSLILLTICLTTSVALGSLSYFSSKNALEAQTFDRLTAIQAAKAAEIRRYFQQIEHQIQTESENPTTVEALESFTAAYELLAQSTADFAGPDQKSALANFYQEEFFPRLNASASSRPLDTAALVPSSGVPLYLQHHYIATNPNLTGEKHLLNRPINDASAYADAHAIFHPIFRSFLEKFSYYDFFLVDSKSGNIVYSVFKETDFGTNLNRGPYRNSNIAQAFTLSNQPNHPSDTHFVDFAPYLPSFNAPAAFVSSPIYKDGEQLGVLILQVPVGRINEVMTNDTNWADHGLGSSGETYLIGPDFTMRSVSRFFIEDPQGYANSLLKLGYPQEKLDQLRQYGTPILNQTVNTDAAVFALAGERGTRIIQDYRKVDVLSSYGPLDFGSKRWAVIAEIDVSEAFAPAVSLQKTISVGALAIAFVSVILGILLAQSLTRPISALTEAAKVIGEGGTIQPLTRHADDEIGVLTSQFNQMVDNLQQQQIVIDRQSTENHQLLLNMLPEPIANRLKNGEAQIADAFPSVSVLFADIVGFTAMSRALPPITILSMLDELFGAFDQAAMDLGVEKIKTIGDSYMAVCGLPYPNDAHADQIAELSLAILSCLQSFNEKNGTQLKMRIGAHSGAVVAGVVGLNKFIYDLWGDTVNMASRMESTGIPDQIQVSEAFRDQLSKPFQLDFRGELEVKGIGSVITYFLNPVVEIDHSV